MEIICDLTKFSKIFCHTSKSTNHNEYHMKLYHFPNSTNLSVQIMLFFNRSISLSCNLTLSLSHVTWHLVEWQHQSYVSFPFLFTNARSDHLTSVTLPQWILFPRTIISLHSWWSLDICARTISVLSSSCLPQIFKCIVWATFIMASFIFVLCKVLALFHMLSAFSFFSTHFTHWAISTFINLCLM